MLIKEIGGEFAFLERIRRRSSSEDILVDNGDDSAVIRVGNEFLSVSTDTIVENDHFSFRYFNPNQIGIKAIEGSCSDIIATGGKPKYIFLALCLPNDMHIEPLEEIYRGMSGACDRLGCSILGGDTTHSKEVVISVTVLGIIKDETKICTRSGARVGDRIFLTGAIGTSFAGLKLFRKDIASFDSVKLKHLEPNCRIDCIDQISTVATSMIDISDGLSSEIHHICRASNVGAVIDESKIPIREDVRQVAALFGDNPLDYAYSGGEDFELLYTVSSDDASLAVGTEIGVITESKVLVRREGRLCELKNTGYNHFL